MKKVTRYICDHCGYIRAAKKTVEKHEAICFKNPATKSCATCKNLESPIIVSENGILTVSKEHYTQMNLSENVKNLELHEYFPPEQMWTSIEQYNGYYCHSKGCIKKLTTNCHFWEEKTKV